MNPIESLPSAIAEVCACPVCSEALEALHCAHCGSDFYSAGGIPCLFPTGKGQLQAWSHMRAMMEFETSQSLEYMEYQLSRHDLLSETRERLLVSHKAASTSSEILKELLDDMGIPSHFDESLQGVPLGSL